jgi:hypothetical protein
MYTNNYGGCRFCMSSQSLMAKQRLLHRFRCGRQFDDLRRLGRSQKSLKGFGIVTQGFVRLVAFPL